MADLLFRQTFFRQMLEKSQFAKLSPCQTSYTVYQLLLQTSISIWNVCHTSYYIGIMINAFNDPIHSKVC